MGITPVIGNRSNVVPAMFLLMFFALGLATMNENRFLLQMATLATFLAFWGGALWGRIGGTRYMREELSRPFPLIDEDGNLHPLMKIGHYYKILATIDGCSPGERLHVLQGRSGDEDGKIFCVWVAGDFVLSPNFQVVKKTEDRGEPAPKTSFVFE